MGTLCTPKTEIGKKGQKLVGINKFWMVWIRFENIQSDPPKEVRGKSCSWRSLQKHIKMTSNYIHVDGLGLDWRIFMYVILSHFDVFLK